MSICFNSSKWFSLDRINGESSIINQFKNQYPPTPVYYSPSNALLWLEVDNYNLTLFATQTTPIVQGSNEITTPGTVGVPVGSVISLGNNPTQYIILQIVGNTITLDKPITLPTNSYTLNVYEIVLWNDSSIYNRTVTGSGSSNRPILGYSFELGKYIALFFYENYLINNNPILSFYNSEIYAIVKEIPSSYNVLYSVLGDIDDNCVVGTNTPLGVKTAFTNSYGEYAEVVQSGGQYNEYKLCRFYLNYNEFASYIELGCSLNGQALTTYIHTINTPILANVREKIGTDYSNDRGFYGEVVEFLIMPQLTPLESAKVEGYLTWKYNLSSILPNTHPYKNIKPLA